MEINIESWNAQSSDNSYPTISISSKYTFKKNEIMIVIKNSNSSYDFIQTKAIVNEINPFDENTILLSLPEIEWNGYPRENGVVIVDEKDLKHMDVIENALSFVEETPFYRPVFISIASIAIIFLLVNNLK